MKDLTAIELPLHFWLHQQRSTYAKARDNEYWHGNIDLLDLAIEGEPSLEDTIAEIYRLVTLDQDNGLTAVSIRDLNQGSIGKLRVGDDAVSESRLLTIAAEPESFRALIYARNRRRLQRDVVEAAKAWRATPGCDATTSTGPWVGALHKMECAIDDLMHWELVP